MHFKSPRQDMLFKFNCALWERHSSIYKTHDYIHETMMNRQKREQSKISIPQTIKFYSVI